LDKTKKVRKEMKLQNILNVLFPVLILFIIICQEQLNVEYDNRLLQLEQKNIEQISELDIIKKSYLTLTELEPAMDDLDEYEDKLDKLEVEVNKFRQDVLFWNEQTGNYFGKYNTGYFREGRGK